MMIYLVNLETKEHKLCSSDGLPPRPWVFVPADPDGWIEWHGGECPLPEGQAFEVKDRLGDIEKLCMPRSNMPHWRHQSDVNDFIAYRPILGDKPQATEWSGIGFPSNGVECEALILADSSHKDWVSGVSEGMIRLPNGRFGCIFRTQKCLYMVGAQDEFRPIRTDRERWIEAADKVVDEGLLSRKTGLEAIYDALKRGDLPTP